MVETSRLEKNLREQSQVTNAGVTESQHENSSLVSGSVASLLSSLVSTHATHHNTGCGPAN